MVEYFGQQLEGNLCILTKLNTYLYIRIGMAFTEYAWVQSYGSRCIRPPIICNNIYRVNPMTIREFKYAQSLTEKPVKGQSIFCEVFIQFYN